MILFVSRLIKFFPVLLKWRGVDNPQATCRLQREEKRYSAINSSLLGDLDESRGNLLAGKPSFPLVMKSGYFVEHTTIIDTFFHGCKIASLQQPPSPVIGRAWNKHQEPDLPLGRFLPASHLGGYRVGSLTKALLSLLTIFSPFRVPLPLLKKKEVATMRINLM